MNSRKNHNPMNDFSSLVDGIKPLKQDKHHFRQNVKPKAEFVPQERRVQAENFFSDTYQPLLPVEGPMRWKREECDSAEFKRLRRGDYVPDLLLDLHGLRQTEAKLEISALLHACVKQSVQCCSVMHGFGTGILKQQIPMWLAQHPQVIAFHQAPKEWGGKAAILVLVDIGDAPHRR